MAIFFSEALSACPFPFYLINHQGKTVFKNERADGIFLFFNKTTGSGMGLNICKNIIEQSGGAIKLISQKTFRRFSYLAVLVRFPKLI